MVPETDVINVIEQPTSSVTSKQMPNKKKNNIAALKEKISRTSEFLQQLKVLSAGCQELDSSQLEKDKEIFSRRTIQVGAEIQDAKDLLSSICKDRYVCHNESKSYTKSNLDYVSTYSISFLRFLFSKLSLYLFRLPDRQWKLLFESDDSDLDDKLGFDLDPSVQFFGIDWERVFGRCFSLSMHVNLLESALALQESELEAESQNKLNKQTNFPNSETHPKSVQSTPELDLVRINKMLKELAAIEADVLSHSEAVLRGRLSKSQRQLIFDEQNKYASLTTQTSISKSKSFRDTGSGSKNRPRQAIKYRKNKTTNLDKLTSSMSAHTIRCGEENNSSTDDGNENNSDEQTNSLLENCKKSTLVSMSASSKRKSTSGSMSGSGNGSNNGSSTTSGFMQNVTSMFKNIR